MPTTLLLGTTGSKITTQALSSVLRQKYFVFIANKDSNKIRRSCQDWTAMTKQIAMEQLMTNIICVRKRAHLVDP